VAAIQQTQRRTTAQHRKKEPVMVVYQNIIVRSSLAEGKASPCATDCLNSIYRDSGLLSIAILVAAKRQAVIEAAGALAEVHRAIRATGVDVATAARVAETLREEANKLDLELAALRADEAAHHEASRAALARHTPLRLAVSARVTALVAERDRIVINLDAMRRAPGHGGRFAELRRAGLTDEQITAIEPSAANPEGLAQSRRERIEEINKLVARLGEFSASPTFEAAHLTGLVEFAGLVAERDGVQA
jgi:hypothetical protein